MLEEYENQNEEKAISEPRIFKRACFESFLAASETMSEITHYTIINKKNKTDRLMLNLAKYVVDLFCLLKSKIYKDKARSKFKDNKTLLKLFDYIKTHKIPLNNLEWRESFFLLEDFMEEYGIIDIGLKLPDISQSFKRR